MIKKFGEGFSAFLRSLSRVHKLAQVLDPALRLRRGFFLEYPQVSGTLQDILEELIHCRAAAIQAEPANEMVKVLKRLEGARGQALLRKLALQRFPEAQPVLARRFLQDAKGCGANTP